MPHPAYGFTEEFRLQVLATAGRVGVIAAAALHGVSITAVRNWRKWYAVQQRAAAWAGEIPQEWTDAVEQRVQQEIADWEAAGRPAVSNE